MRSTWSNEQSNILWDEQSINSRALPLLLVMKKNKEDTENYHLKSEMTHDNVPAFCKFKPYPFKYVPIGNDTSTNS